jgi:outer membrane murein-binding lipoprotein Lpp
MSETKESLLDKLSSKMAKIMLSSEAKSDAKEVKLEIAKLEDGTEVEIEGDDISVLVKQEGEEVEKVPAPVGEHTLEDGSVVVVKEEGKIDEVKPKAETEEVEAKDEKEMDLASEVETLKEEMAKIKEEMKAMKPEKEEMAKEEVEPQAEPKKEELSKVTHSPEKNVKSKVKVKLKSNGGIKSRVYSKLFS